jgi:hypothetical protein
MLSAVGSCDGFGIINRFVYSGFSCAGFISEITPNN